VFFNRELFYPHGVRVALEGNASSVVSVKCPSVRTGSSVLQLVQTASLPSQGASVSVSITRCLSALDAACTCK
jgi:hypothetical protein